MPSSRRHLDYAQAGDGLTRRRIIRLIALIVVVAICLSVFKWQRNVRRRIILLHRQHQAMTYSAAADQVVFSMFSNDTALLSASPGYKRFAHVIGYVPPIWEGFCANLLLPRQHLGGVAFLHELKSRNGDSRLVVVEELGVEAESEGSLTQILEVTIFQPASYGSDPLLISEHRAGIPLTFGEFPAAGRVFAGQIDPADPSHFTIVHEVNGTRVTLDGWLQDDGSQVDLEKRLEVIPRAPASAAQSQ